jgi:hypothetical protein
MTGVEIPDVIQSYLVEHPNSYYMPPNNQHLWYLDRQAGLILVQRDFTNLSHEEISDIIIAILEDLR